MNEKTRKENTIKMMNEDQVNGLLKGEQWETEQGEVYTLDRLMEEINAIPSTDRGMDDTIKDPDDLPFQEIYDQ